MAKIERKFQKIFGGSADVSLFNQFGSAALGSPVASKDLDVIQGISAFLNGFTAETVGDWIPVLEDFNALEFMYTTQLAYIFQSGIPEYDSGTTYYIGSYCQVAGQIYISLDDDNIGHTPASSPAYWDTYPFTRGDNVYTDYSATSTIVGWSAFEQSKKIFYKKIGTTLFVDFWIQGTSNSTLASFTLPFDLNVGPGVITKPIEIADNSSHAQVGLLDMKEATSVVNIYPRVDNSDPLWTASNNKMIRGSFNFEIYV